MKLFTYFLIILIFLAGCSSEKEKKDNTEAQMKDKTSELFEFVEQNKAKVFRGVDNYLMEAETVHQLLDSNILIIDLRDPDDFEQGHISGSVNILIPELFDYFENKIEAKSYNRIVLTCYAGQKSSFALCLARLVGYDNVYAMRWGVSAWNEFFAKKHWLQHTEEGYYNALEMRANHIEKFTSYPKIESDENDMEKVLKQRIKEVAEKPFNDISYYASEVLVKPSDYYIVCNCLSKTYNYRHIRSSVHFQPAKPFELKDVLSRFPDDKIVVLYSETGHESAFTAAYLRVFGYDARTLLYGANGFMYGKIPKSSGEKNTFNAENYIMNYPFESKQKADL